MDDLDFDLFNPPSGVGDLSDLLDDGMLDLLDNTSDYKTSSMTNSPYSIDDSTDESNEGNHSPGAGETACFDVSIVVILTCKDLIQGRTRFPESYPLPATFSHDSSHATGVPQAKTSSTRRKQTFALAANDSLQMPSVSQLPQQLIPIQLPAVRATQGQQVRRVWIGSAGDVDWQSRDRRHESAASRAATGLRRAGRPGPSPLPSHSFPFQSTRTPPVAMKSPPHTAVSLRPSPYSTIRPRQWVKPEAPTSPPGIASPVGQTTVTISPTGQLVRRSP
jgi:hypothetical protein